MPELTEVLNKPAAEAEKNDSATESDSDDSVPDLEDTGAGGNNQTQVSHTSTWECERRTRNKCLFSFRARVPWLPRQVCPRTW